MVNCQERAGVDLIEKLSEHIIMKIGRFMIYYPIFKRHNADKRHENFTDYRRRHRESG